MSAEVSQKFIEKWTSMNATFGPSFQPNFARLTEPHSAVVIKLGGAIIRDQLREVTDAAQTLSDLEIPLIITHGAGPQIDSLLKERGIPEKKIDGLRVTDEDVMQAVIEASEDTNDLLYESFRQNGINAQQFTLEDAIFKSEPLDAERLFLVGDVADVNIAPIKSSISQGAVPVITSLGTGPEGPLNVNGDTASAALVRKLTLSGFVIPKFVTLTSPGGVLDKKGDVIPVINLNKYTVSRLIDNGTIDGGMIPKIEELAALVEGLPDTTSVVITKPASLANEFFTDNGEGTLLRKADQIERHTSLENVNLAKVKSVIESAFSEYDQKANLRPSYFSSLPPSSEFYIVGDDYKGLAVVLPGEKTNSSVEPAYLDKIAIDPNFQGYGVGSELMETVIAQHPEGLYWRTKMSKTKNIEWYSTIADTWTKSHEWAVFFVNIPSEEQAAYAQKAIAIEPSVMY